MKDKKQPKEKLESQSSEEILRQLAEKYELLAENTLDLIFQTTKTGKFTYVSSSCERISAYKPEEMIGKRFTGFVPKKEWPRYFGILKATLSGKEIDSFETHVVHKDGHLVPVEFNGKLVKSGKDVFIQGVMKDITERKKAEEALQKAYDGLEKQVKERTAELFKTNKMLRESGERYSLITENTSDLIALTTFTLNPTYTYASPSHEKIVGYMPENLIGKPCFNLVHPDDKKKLLSMLRKYVDEGSKKFLTEKDLDVSEAIQYRFKDKSGNWHHLESTVDIVGNELLFISKDFTERRRTEENYKILFNSSPYAITLLAEDGEILSVNIPMTKSLGISIKELVGKNIHKILPKDVDEKRTVVARKALETGEIQENDDERDERYFHNSFVPIFTSDGKKGIQVISRDITERKNMEKKISKLNECFLSLGSDARKNIEIIVNAAGEILGGACLLYNRLEKERGLLCTWGIWNEPEGYKPEDDPEGHICYDVIEGNKEVVIIEDLSGTKYEKTDPNVKKYKLKSYLGYPIRLKGEAVGSFCLCGVKKRKFTQDEIKIMSMLAQAVANEEERKLAQDELQKAHDELEKRVKERTAELSRTNEVLQIEITEHNKAEEEIKITKDYLDNVIDSASEFMLVIDTITRYQRGIKLQSV